MFDEQRSIGDDVQLNKRAFTRKPDGRNDNIIRAESSKEITISNLGAVIKGFGKLIVLCVI